MELAIGWIVLSFVVAVVANARDKSGVGYFFISLVLSPLIGLILAVAIPKATPTPTVTTHRKCPDCAELVLNEARVCKHCGAKLTPPSHATNEPDQVVL